MKLTDMIISAILKKGILYEARNCDIEMEIPMDRELENRDGAVVGTKEIKILVRFKAEHMSLRVEKE